MAKINTVRVVKTKYGTYSLHFTSPDGNRRRLSVGSHRQAAERLAVRCGDWLLEGKDPEREMEHAKQTEKAKAITLREFFPVFMERYGCHRAKKTQESYHGSFQNLCRCPELMDTPMGNIRRGTVIDYMNVRMRQEGVTAATVNREKAFISVMLSRAVEADILDRNPILGLKSFKEADKREVSLTPSQAAALIDALPTQGTQWIVAFAIYSSWRMENILSLRIEDVIFHDTQPTASVRLTVKGGKVKTLMLSENAVEVLKQAADGRKEGYVFISPKTGTRYKARMNSFDKAVRKLGLTAENGSKLRFHDLRHVYSSWLHQAGVSLDDLRWLLGHEDRSTTDRYVTPNLQVVGEALKLQPRIEK